MKVIIEGKIIQSSLTERGHFHPQNEAIAVSDGVASHERHLKVLGHKSSWRVT